MKFSFLTSLAFMLFANFQSFGQNTLTPQNKNFEIVGIGEHGFGRDGDMFYYKLDIEVKNNTNLKLKRTNFCASINQGGFRDCNSNIHDLIWYPDSIIKFVMFINNDKVNVNTFDRTPKNILLSIYIDAHNIDIDFDELVINFNIKDDWKDFQKVLGLRDIEPGEKLKIIKPPNNQETNEEIKSQSFKNELFPIYPGCEKGDNEAKRNCMSSEINKFIGKNFNTKIASKLGLSGRQRINVIFKIDTTGSITEIRARAPHPGLEEEAKRVIGMLPKLKAGTRDGKPVTVPFSLPIIFDVSD